MNFKDRVQNKQPSFGLVETGLELDNLMSVLAKAFNVPSAFFGIVGAHREIVHASYGTSLDVIDRNIAFCSHVVDSGSTLVVNDAQADKRFADNPMVLGEPHIRFYAGAPVDVEGDKKGVVCLIDSKPRNIEKKKLILLNNIADLIGKHLALKKEHELLKSEHGLIEHSPLVLMSWQFDSSLKLMHVSNNVSRILGVEAQDLLSGHVQIIDVLDSASEEDFTFAMQAHIERVQTHTCRLRINAPTRTIWVSMISTANFDEDGTLATVQAFLFDTSDQKYIEDKLHDTNQRMRLLLEASELGTWDWNIKADVNQVNKRWCEIVGVDYEDYDTSARFFRQRIHPADMASVEKKLNEHLLGKTPSYNATFRMRHENGTWVWVESYGKTVESDYKNEAIRIAGIHRDITDKMLKELKEKKKTQLLQFINKTREAYLNTNDLTQACQTVLAELLDLADSQFAFIGQMIDTDSEPKLFIHAISDIVWDSTSLTQYREYKNRNLYFTSFDNLFGKVVTSGDVVISNSTGTHPSSKGTPKGHPRITRFLGMPIKLQREVVGMIGIANKFDAYSYEDADFFQPLLDALSGLFYAVSLEQARAEAEEKLRKLAMTDPLTGLANRRAFLDRCELLTLEDKQCVVAIIDIDFFKKVNDTYGHDAGDEALLRVATILQNQGDSRDMMARLGGEEFALVAVDKSEEEVALILETLRKDVENTPIIYKDDVISLTISIGRTPLSNALNADFGDLLSQADKALYESKSSGRNSITLFTPALTD